MSEQNPTVSEILRDTQANLPKVEDYGYDPSTLLNTTSLLGTTYFVPSQSTTSNSGAMPFDESVVPGALTGTEEGQGVPMTGLFTLGDATEASGAIRLVIADGKGDVYLASGKTDFVTTTAGFILGIDDSDSNKTKLYLGDATNYLYWDGSNLTITGSISATALDIGGADATSWHVDSSGNMWSGNATYAGAPFTVSSAGALVSTSGTIGGFTIGATTLTATNLILDSSAQTITTGSSGANVKISSDKIELRTGTTVQGTIKAAVGGGLSGGDVSQLDVYYANIGGGSAGSLNIYPTFVSEGGVGTGIGNSNGNPIEFAGSIAVGSNKAYNLGTAAYAWDNVYSDDFQNVADFLFLDSKDDIAELRKIKGSGIIHPKTGIEMIDDNTVPEWLLTKKKTGEIAYSEDGKPYIAVKTMLSLLMGAVRQLDDKIEALKT